VLVVREPVAGSDSGREAGPRKKNQKNEINAGHIVDIGAVDKMILSIAQHNWGFLLGTSLAAK
jgi:hypothetical protein